MSNAWGGANPVSVVDLSTYDLGVKYRANLSDIIITDLRIFGGDSGTMGGRQAHLFTLAGGTLAALALPNTMTPGWATYALGAPVQINAGSTFWVAYDTTGSYGFIGSVGYPVNSVDGLVTAIGAGFNTNVDQMPNQDTNSFYGLDFVYSLVGSNAAPVASLSVVPSGLTAQAIVGITDESPGTCNVVVEWGDGVTISGTGPQTFAHTYASPGLYAVMVTVTDAGGLKDSAAAIAQIVASYASPLVAGTAEFIAANPVSITLLPRVETRTAAGGKVRETGPARAPQTFRLIPQNATAANVPGVVRTADGTQRKADYFLLGMPDAVVAVGDSWTSGGKRYEIMELLPDNGYERRARVMVNG